MRAMKVSLRRWRLTAAFVVIPVTSALLGLAFSTSAQSQTGAPVMPDKNGFIPRATVVEIMDSMVMSTADVLWNAVGVSSSENGIVENKPETDEDWQRLRWAAVTMAEASNALLIPGRHAAPPGTPRDPSDPSLGPDEIDALIAGQWQVWVAMAHALDAAALQAIRAIDAHDADQVGEVGGTIDEACEACHLVFWYPEPQ